MTERGFNAAGGHFQRFSGFQILKIGKVFKPIATAATPQNLWRPVCAISIVKRRLPHNGLTGICSVEKRMN
jgi:hypothetical protein